MATQGYTTIKHLVKRTLHEMGDESMRKYALFKGYAIDCLRDFHMDILQEVKTVKLTMDDIKTVDKPVDFVSLVKLGVQIGDKVKVFLLDNNIALYNDQTDCGEDIPNTSGDDVNALTPYDLNNPYYFFNYVNEHGEAIGGLYGYGNGIKENAFKIDGKKIRFNSNVNTSNVYMEYVSNGFNPTEESVIQTSCEQCVKDYIKWRYFSDTKGPFSNDAQGWKQNYGLEVKKAKARISPFSIPDLLDAAQSGYMLSPKY